jgi:short-subunit dehydrogenase
MSAHIDLRGSRALVTGATGGIGQAIARRLSEEGAELVLSGRRLDVLEPLAKELEATAIAADLEDLAEVDRLMTEAGSIDVLIANAALSASGELLEYTSEQLARALTVNLHAPIAMARTAAMGMVERGRGHIVMIGSVSGKLASPNSSLYNATKFGLRGFALGFRQDLDDKGVGVSIVEPGFVREAGMFVNSGAKLPAGGRTSSPEDVANGVVKAIRRDRAEVVVAPIEIRAAALAFAGLPGIAESVQKASGAAKVSSGIAEGQRHNR